MTLDGRGDSPSERIPDLVETVAARLREGHCRFFFGAGLPATEAGLPRTRDLAASLQHELSTSGRFQDIGQLWDDGANKPVSEIPLSTAAELYSLHDNRQALIRLIEDRLRQPHPENGLSYKALSSLSFRAVEHSQVPLLSRMYTTNFDVSIEKAMGSIAKTITRSNQRELSNADLKDIHVLHLHGAVGCPAADYVLTETDELEQLTELRKNSALASLLHADLATETVVFVGYSLSDIDLRLTRYFVMLGTDSSNPNHYAVVPKSVGHVPDQEQVIRWQVIAKIWEARRVYFIDLTSADFFLHLTRSMEFHDQAELVAAIARRHNRSKDQIVSDAQKLLHQLELATANDALHFLDEAL